MKRYEPETGAHAATWGKYVARWASASAARSMDPFPLDFTTCAACSVPAAVRSTWMVVVPVAPSSTAIAGRSKGGEEAAAARSGIEHEALSATAGRSAAAIGIAFAKMNATPAA